MDSFSTSTRVAKVLTDQGVGFLKAMGNPEGPHVLACELVATRLAAQFGLPTLESAIISVTEIDEIPFLGGGQAEPGPAYITKEMAGTPWGGGATELKKIVNQDDITRLVVFDTWIRNRDRHSPPGGRKPNLDNVFLSVEPGDGKLRLIAMDHTHCFSSGSQLTERIADIYLVQDNNVFGLFPEFQDFLDGEVVYASAEWLCHLNRDEVSAIVAEIPGEWDVPVAVRQAMTKLIVDRAHYLGCDNKITRLLWPQREIFDQ